jgi:DNA helicase-2/ATP-dependent DNA helicase PcrA
MPYEIVGGLTFFERREVKDLLAYLRVLVNPLDDVSMGRIVNVPPRGLGKAGIEKLREIAFAEGMSLREAVGETSLHGEFGPKAQEGARRAGEGARRAQRAPSKGRTRPLKVILPAPTT